MIPSDCFRLSTLVLLVFHAAAFGSETTNRGLKICVASDAPPIVRSAAERVLAAAPTHPLLSVMSGSQGAPKLVTDSKDLLSAKPAARAFDHLVLVGLIDDPLIRSAWQREARAEEGGMYVFGIGHLVGDIGYIESDRNPFLHSRFIPRAPYETEVVTITGSTPEGVALAADMLLKDGLINGTIAGKDCKRSKPGLLDREPLSPELKLLEWLPTHVGIAQQIGVSQAGEDEYRGVLEDTGVEPQTIWKIKYYLPGAWDGAGADNAFVNYANGLHRRACGNVLWCADFQTAAQAGLAAPKIALAAKLKQGRDGWSGSQPFYGPQKESAGPLALWLHDQWVLMSTLPEPVTHVLKSQTRSNVPP